MVTQWKSAVRRLCGRARQEKRHQVMRRKVVSFSLLGLVLSTPIVGAPAVTKEPGSRVSAPVAIQRAALPGPWIREEVAMVMAGTALIGLAAAVRRAA